MRLVTGWASGVEVRAGGVGESELDKLVSMSSGPELLVRNSSLSLSTSGQGEPRGSEEGEGDGKEEVEEEADAEDDEEEASSDSTEAARNALGHSSLVHDPSLCPLVLSLDSTITRPPSQFAFVICDGAFLTCWDGQEGGKEAVEEAETMLTEEEEQTMLTGSIVCNRLCRSTKLNWVGPGQRAATCRGRSSGWSFLW